MAKPHRPPPITFSDFVLGLSAHAAAMLGADDEEDTRVKGRVDLVSAAQFIDTLQLLQEKTAGNLSQEEEKLLGSLLYELRMKYIEVESKQG